ncbi:MAG: TfoX/Sxy family protein [Polaromonas sp.]|nr:TfoX/Sxy family protein [Polaromonas sp.]
MATPRDDFALYCCELLAGVGPCTARRMFGGYGISQAGLTLALVADLGGGEKLWLKADAETRARFEAAGCERFSYQVTRNGQRALHSLNYYSAPEEAMESAQWMLQWARVSLACALKARSAQSPRARAATKMVANPVRAAAPAATTPPAKPRASRPSAPSAKRSAKRKSAKG